jgi:membrane protein DedA with SNARE-associated domain
VRRFRTAALTVALLCIAGTAAVQVAHPPSLPLPGAEPLGASHYLLLFGWLVLAGLGLPPGEDLMLAGAGTLVGHGILSWWPVILLSAASVVTSDVILFSVGRSAKAFTRPQLLSGRWRKRFDALMHRWGRLAIAAARFLPGARTLIFAAAGANGMSPRTFLLIDTCAAFAWVVLIVSAGTWLGGCLL